VICVTLGRNEKKKGKTNVKNGEHRKGSPSLDWAQDGDQQGANQIVRWIVKKTRDKMKGARLKG